LASSRVLQIALGVCRQRRSSLESISDR
jgi:hypothetical protein